MTDLPTSKSAIFARVAEQMALPMTDITQSVDRLHRTPAKVNVDTIPTYDAHKRAELRAPIIAGAMHRPIELADMTGANRGLQIGLKTVVGLHLLIEQHAGKDMFASAVIVAAATAQLHKMERLNPDRFNMVELVAMRRTPIDEITCIIEAEITKRADHIREHAAMCAVGVHSWTSMQGKIAADTKCDYCDELYGEPR